MRSETLNLLFSFLGLLMIPCAVVLLSAVIGRGLFKKSWPKMRELLLSSAVASGITVVITLAICLLLQWTGFLEAQFYRPSSRDFGRAAELGLQPDEVHFDSLDGTSLHGWFLPATDAVGTVVTFHGSDRNITDTVKNTHWLTAHGFNVFVFDYRGYGKSAGEPDRRGLVDDSVAVVQYVASRKDVDRDRIVLYGQSMGGQLAINAAVKAECDIQLVIAEATYAKPSYHISDKLGRMGPLWLVKWGTWLITSDELSGERAIARLQTPVLLVHGQDDSGVAPYHSERLLAAATGPKEIWRYDDYQHLNIFVDEDNRQRLANFIREKLGASDQKAREFNAQDVSGPPTATNDVVLRDLTDRDDSQLAADLQRLRAVKSPLAVDLTWSNLENGLLSNLHDLPNLRRLNLFGATGVTDDALRHLENLPALESIDLGGARVSSQGILSLRNARNLKQLGLANVSPPLDDAAIEQIVATWPDLESISLDGAHITDVGLARIGTLKKLTYLNISDTGITARGMGGLVELRSLKTLHASHTELDDSAMIELAQITSLEKLDFNSTNITNAGLIPLRSLRHLKRIYLVDTRVDDDGLGHLKTLKSIEYVGVGENITPEGLEALKRALPRFRRNTGG